MKATPQKKTPKAQGKDFKFNLGALGDLTNQEDSYKIIKP